MIGRGRGAQPMVLFILKHSVIFNQWMYPVSQPALTAAAGLDKCPAPFADPLSKEPLRSAVSTPNTPLRPQH